MLGTGHFWAVRSFHPHKLKNKAHAVKRQQAIRGSFDLTPFGMRHDGMIHDTLVHDTAASRSFSRKPSTAGIFFNRVRCTLVFPAGYTAVVYFELCIVRGVPLSETDRCKWNHYDEVPVSCKKVCTLTWYLVYSYYCRTRFPSATWLA